MSEMSKELRFWATDDIVPADLQHLCNRAADCHEALVKVLEKIEDQASRATLVQDRSVSIIKQTCAIIAREAKAALAAAEKE